MPEENAPVRSLSDTVINNGYCIGCGACTFGQQPVYEIKANSLGQYEAVSCQDSIAPDLGGAERVCPFSENIPNENELSELLFPESPHSSSFLGRYDSVFAGVVSDEGFRRRGSSGGIGKWILEELLRRELVDFVVQVKPCKAEASGEPLFEFSIDSRLEDVRSGSRSAYYPVTMAKVLAHISENPGRYVITGIPCFVKAVRLLQREHSVFQERIKYCLGVICGHLKTLRYADMLAWQMGIEPGELGGIDFRVKIPGKSAKQKGVMAVSRSSGPAAEGPKSVDELFGANYNDGLFQYKACDFCDDVVAELADVSVGDAWLPQYIKDGRGTSLVIVRNAAIAEILTEALEDKQIQLDLLSEEEAVSTQIGGFRQRREGLQVRLEDAKRRNEWHPPKRVKPGQNRVSRKRRRIYRARVRLAEQSKVLFEQALQQKDFSYFRSEMAKIIDEYRALYAVGFLERITKAVKRRTRFLARNS